MERAICSGQRPVTVIFENNQNIRIGDPNRERTYLQIRRRVVGNQANLVALFLEPEVARLESNEASEVDRES